MSKKMLIDATHAEETRVVVVDGNRVEDFDFESENKRQLAGNIYLAKVTRVEPSLQAAFVDYGGNRHGFLAFSEIHPDYYQIPVADREALLAEEMALDAAEAEEEEAEKPKRRSRRGRGRAKAAEAENKDAVATEEVAEASGEDSGEPSGDDAAPETEASADAPAAEAEEGNGDDSAPRAIPGMDVVDLDEEGDDDAYNAAEHAAQNDDSVEAVSDDDSPEEIRRPRKQRPRRYKIQEVIKVRQILLVQVVKEERGNKGAALTTYLSLAGRYCVLMPNTARGGGISRKITQAADRKKLKEIANEIDVPKGAGLIIRTAGAKRTKTEIKRDYEYLQRLWEQIRELTLKSIAPAKIYEEGNLIKRSIRDLYNRDIEEVLVEGDLGYRTAKDFMKMIMPSHAKNVKHYHDQMPLFARYQVESYLSSMFNPTVQLKSGGYIVIGVTEALVAIDVNSGKATKEGSIEETALKTNLEAAEEVARQLRLRDLAGLVVIDFIDMEERRNNAAVEKRFKEKLKVDRARIQVGRISAFGLLEMSRQRLRPGMLEASTQPCPSCHGTGLIRSEDSLGLTILRQIEEEGVRRRTKEVLVKAPVSIVNFLMNHKREHIAQIEARYGMAVRVEADPFLISPDFSLEKFKTATRIVKESAPVVSADAMLMAAVEEDMSAEAEAEAEEEDIQDTPETAEASDEDRPKKKRRRRRRRRGKGENGDREEGAEGNIEAADRSGENGEDSGEAAETPVAAEAEEASAAEETEKPKRRRSRSRKKPADEAEAKPEETAAEEAPSEAPAAEDTPAPEAEADAAEEKPAKPKRTRSRKKKTEEAPAPEAAQDEAPAEEAAPEPQAEPEPTPEPEPEPAAAGAGGEPAPEPEPALEETSGGPEKPRRKGWWSMGRG
ncbi:Rne/Rng family ribonuclease [Alphaproteobacteria bacterium GH1-50]|uniref:Ribonuclease E n=1 Tax=Kangsaoukella pontilimi TaxID=2691042 RepID=A0A7C9IG58_9RHOB|nr:ribonuclease E/G [Kangsaoukella pontilimi]MXQ07667.1 Rne/Rng family ribonuclease [Kangsaoukella pontilimi]